MPLHSFFLCVSTDTHISSVVDRRVHYWIIIRQCPSYSKNLMKFFPRYIMPLVIVSSPFVNHALLSSLCCLLLKFVVYAPKMPLWVEPMPPLIRLNLRVLASLTLLVFCQITFRPYNFIEREK